jgi:[ribosomal protein S5]-alanine N-acetyltransferase
MAFLRTATPEDYLEPIRGPNLVLRAPSATDYGQWAELRARSRAHLTPWEPAWSHDDLSRLMFRRRLKAYARDVRDDAAYAYFITDARSGVLYGGVIVGNVRRGASQSAALGYWIGAPYTGQGRMQEALRMLLPVAFGTLRLHRIEAATMVHNAPSIRVLEKSGFNAEGVVRGYLKINGRWEDHILHARLATLADSTVPRGQL